MRRVTFWKNKDGNGYAPLYPEFIDFSTPNGDVVEISEALGEDYASEELLMSSYKKLDKVMSQNGIENRFTTKLFESYVPKIVKLTDEEYSLWRHNCEEA